MPMHVCVHGFMGAPVCLCVEARSLKGHSPGAIHLVFGVMVSHGPSKTADYPVSPTDLPVSASSVLGLQIRALCPVLYVGAGGHTQVLLLWWQIPKQLNCLPAPRIKNSLVERRAP